MVDLNTGDISLDAEPPNQGHPERCDHEHWFPGPLILNGYWSATKAYWAADGERRYRHQLFTKPGMCLGCGKHWRELCKTPVPCLTKLKDIRIAVPCHVCGKTIRKPQDLQVNRKDQYAHFKCAYPE